MYMVSVVVDCVLQVLCWLIIIDCIFSFIPSMRYTKIADAISNIVDPMLNPVRKLLSSASVFENLPIDFSPVIVIIILDFISSLI